MHLGWGIGTLAGIARFGPPVAAIRLAVARGARDAPPQPVDGVVYSPSLHDSGG